MMAELLDGESRDSSVGAVAVSSTRQNVALPPPAGNNHPANGDDMQTFCVLVL